MVVPSPAGSLPDALVRTLQPQLQAALKQPIVIENRPGAGGGLAGGYVAKALPDGYTLLFAIDTMLTINPFVYPSLAYNPVKDFKPISLLGKAGFVVVANPKIGVSTISELSRAPIARPGGLNYGSGGIGHATHILRWNSSRSTSEYECCTCPFAGRRSRFRRCSAEMSISW